MGLLEKLFRGRGRQELAAPPAALPKSGPTPELGSVLRQHFVTALYARVVDTIGLFNPKNVSINDRLLMRTDPAVAFGNAALVAPIVNTEWSVESRDEKIKAFINAEFQKHYRPIALADTNAIGLGYQVSEKVWQAGPVTIDLEDNVGGTTETVRIPMAWTFEKVKPIDPRTVVLHVDPKTDKWDGVQQYIFIGGAYRPGDALIGPERVALWSFLQEYVFGKLTGWPLFNQVYPDWWDLSAVSMYANRYFESKGDPTPIGRADLNGMLDANNEKTDGLAFMAGVLKLFKGGNGVVLPSSRDEKGEYLYGIEILEDSKRGDQFESYMKYKETRIHTGLFMPPRVGGAHAGSGLGTKDAGVQQDEAAELRELILSSYFAHFNKSYVDPYVLYNFGPEALEQSKTRLVPAGMSSGMKDTLKEFALKALDNEAAQGSGTSIPLRKQMDVPGIFRALNVPVPSAEDLKKLEAEQAEENAAAKALSDAALANTGGAGGGGFDGGAPKKAGSEGLDVFGTDPESDPLLRRAEALANERRRLNDLGEIRTELEAKIEAARKPEAPPIDPEKLVAATGVAVVEAIKALPAPAPVTINEGDVNVAPSPAPEVKLGDVNVTANLKPGDKTISLKKTADGIEGTSKSEGGGA